jgi:hypothetical protein
LNAAGYILGDFEESGSPFLRCPQGYELGAGGRIHTAIQQRRKSMSTAWAFEGLNESRLNSYFIQQCQIQMSDQNKAILEESNAAIVAGNNEGFLSF